MQCNCKRCRILRQTEEALSAGLALIAVLPPGMALPAETTITHKWVNLLRPEFRNNAHQNVSHLRAARVVKKAIKRFMRSNG